MEIKNGTEINGVLEKIELEWTLKDGSTETMALTWEELDTDFIRAIKAFVIRKLS